MHSKNQRRQLSSVYLIVGRNEYIGCRGLISFACDYVLVANSALCFQSKAYKVSPFPLLSSLSNFNI